MNALVFDTLARIGAAGLADSLVLGFAVAFIAWAVLFLLRKHRASTRFTVLLFAVGSLALLPVLRSVLADHAVAAGASVIRLSDSWAAIVAGIWALGAAVGLARIAAGLMKLRSLRRGCRPLPQLSSALQDTVRESCPSRAVQLLVSDTVSVPSAIGFRHPAVILPAWLLDELSPAELRHVLIHELSHLRRRDDWTNLFQQIVKALLFFHPAMWWMENRIALEREMACDDAVLAQADSPRGYAECLAHLAERSLLRRGLAMAQAAVSRVRQTSHRVARILQFDRAARGGKFAVSLAAVLALVGYGAVLDAPTLVTFNNIASPIVPSSVASSVVPSWSRPFLASQDGAVPPKVNAVLHEPESPVQHTRSAALAASGTVPSVALASSRQFRRHLDGKPAPDAPRALDATFSAPHSAPVVKTLAQQQPSTVHASQAAWTSPDARAMTIILVVHQQDSVSVWQITSWQYVPSQQVRANRKIT